MYSINIILKYYNFFFFFLILKNGYFDFKVAVIFMHFDAQTDQIMPKKKTLCYNKIKKTIKLNF